MFKRTLSFVLVFLLFAAITAHASSAEEQSVFDATHTMRDNLKQLQASGKAAELVLKNGKSYAGKLATVGDNAVVVTEISGREFYDALILIDEIAAIEARVRGR